jgi:glycosyltransferase involved in cell wall biosynthesis
VSATVLGVLPALGGSLADLARSGQAERVLDHYLPAYLERFARVRWFSYRTETLEEYTDDRELRARVEVVSASPRLPRRVAAATLGAGPWRRALRGCGVVRVLQAPGAVPALLAGARYVCTYGYAYPAFTEVRFAGPLAPAARAAKRPLMRVGLRTILRRAAATIVTADAVEQEARRLGARTVWTIPNGVDVARFAPRDVERRYDVAFVGQLVPRKDVETLVRAAGSLTPPPSLAVVGEGPLEEELRRRCDEAGVPAAFLGRLGNTEVAAVLARARSFVLPSRAEGHPKALLEAMATGVPSVGADIPGIRELGASGAVSLFRPGDAAALARVLRDVLADGDHAAALGARARALVVERFDLARLLAEEASLLARAAAGDTAQEAAA